MGLISVSCLLNTSMWHCNSIEQTQLGGPRVMGVNGVSHHLATDDLDGACTMLKLLAFCPPDLGGAIGGFHPGSWRVLYVSMLRLLALPCWICP
jgi:hypothetical protein